MTNEFTSWCSYYYELDMLLTEMEEHFLTLLDNTPNHLGQTNANEVDAIIAYCRMVQAERDKIDKTSGELWDAQYTILAILQHFEIPPGTVLTGEIPYEMSFEVWADEEDNVYVNKTGDLAPEEDDPNVMIFKFTRGSNWKGLK